MSESDQPPASEAASVIGVSARTARIAALSAGAAAELERPEGQREDVRMGRGSVLRVGRAVVDGAVRIPACRRGDPEAAAADSPRRRLDRRGLSRARQRQRFIIPPPYSRQIDDVCGTVTAQRHSLTAYPGPHRTG